MSIIKLLFFPLDVFAQAEPPPYSAGPETPLQIRDLEAVFARVLNIALGFAGIAFFLMFVVGGFKYLTSGGDPKNAESARKTLTFAVGGLVFITLSYLILVFISEFTGLDLTVFRIYVP